LAEYFLASEGSVEPYCANFNNTWHLKPACARFRQPQNIDCERVNFAHET
jgi:hypothetical protein